MPDSRLTIAGREVGPGQPCFVIAEAGVNHNGDAALAKEMVDAAAEAGADAVKFQTFKAEQLASAHAPKAEYQARQTGAGESQRDMIKRLELSEDAFADLRDRCAARGVVFLSTPFEQGSADFLRALGMAAFKVPSGEITNLPFLAHLARMGRPLLVSTGMSTLAEVDAAVRAVRDAGEAPLALLQCVSNYPAAPADCNLRAMATMAAAFGVPVGYSDHTLGTEVALAAVALGACVLEKHFTTDRTAPGPDHAASLEPGELAAMIRQIRSVESALGDGRKAPAASEANTAAVARKSLVAARPIRAGATLAEGDVAIKRPGTGLSPSLLPLVLGRRARRDIAADELLGFEVLG